MNLDADSVRKVAAALEKSKAVPLPGGHGVYFGRVLAMCPHRPGVPGVAERCYVALASLGDAEEKGKWNRKEWLPHAESWFDVHGGHLAREIDTLGAGQRWEYLLAGMALVVRQSIGHGGFDKMHLAESADLESKARERLQSLTRGDGAPRGVPLGGHGAAGVQVPPSMPVTDAWRFAAQALCSADSDRVLMLYFMYTLHSSLGMPQPELDEPYSTRKRVYGQLKAILEEGSIASCRLRPASLRVAAALGTTPMLNEAGQKPPWTARLSAQLPSCFREAHLRSRPPIRALVEAQLHGDPEAVTLLLSAHDLAEAVADLVLDPVRASRPGFQTFSPLPHYKLFCSQVLDGGRKYKQLEFRDELPPDDIAVGQDGPSTARPMSASLAKCYARDDYYIAHCQSRLKSVSPKQSWVEAVQVERCMLCHAQATVRR